MAGGIFDKTVGKTRPGTYINFTSKEPQSIAGSSRGTVIIPLGGTDYGPAKKMITLTAAAVDAAKAMLGYSIYDDDKAGNMLLIREAFKKASSVIVYICTDGTAAATGTGGGLKATAKYKGTRGNDFKFSVVANPDGTFDVEVYLANARVEIFEKIASAADLSGSEYLNFAASGVGSLSGEAGVALSGGTNAEKTQNADVTDFLDASEGVKWNAMCFPFSEEELLAAAKTKIKYLRENVGKKRQVCLSGLDADYEGVINVVNGYCLGDRVLTAVQSTAMAAGMTAGASYVQSNTYRQVDGATEVNGVMTHEEAVKAIKKGSFFFSTDEEGRVVVEYDINTLVTFADGKGESYRKNRVIRVLDAFNDSIAINFPPNKFDNNGTGWDIMEGLGNSILKAYEEAGAITEVDYDNDFKVDRDASHGDQTYFIIGIKPVDSAEKLFFSVTTR